MSNLASKKQLRYLLHGKQEHFDDIDTPLYITSQDSSLWQKIAQQVLEQKQELWRLIDGSLASELSNKQRQYLIISSFEAKQVIELIKELGAESVKGESLNPEEKEQLLIEASNHNEIELWKKFKLHEDINNNLVTIDENTYLKISEINIEFPQQLQGRVTLIKLSNNTLQVALQSKHISEWNEKTAINFLLNQEQPHRYFAYILKLLNQLNTDDKRDINKKLKQTKWLTDSSCKIGIAPQDVIDIKHEKLKKHISIIVKLEEGKYTTSDLHHQLKNEQKLSSLFSYWDEKDVITKILSCPNPHEHCWIILDALDSLFSNNNNYDDPNLSAVAWLITIENKPIAPANVIYHDDFKNNIQYIFTEAHNQHIETEYVEFLMLDKEIKSKYSKVWEYLKDKLFIHKIDDIIRKLEEKEIIKQLPNYGLGSFTHPNDLTIEDIDKWTDEIKIFDHIDPKILPCWSFLKKISSTQRKNILLSLQSSPLSPERFVAILNYLSEHFKGNDKDAIAVYNKYLQSACTDVETFRDLILRNIQLLNQKNEWKSPQELCDPKKNHSIDLKYLLEQEQQEVLSLYLENVTDKSIESSKHDNSISRESSSLSNIEKLQKYFTPWLVYVSPECIGIFLCLLAGKDEEMRKLAINYLEKRGFGDGFEKLRERLIWSHVIIEKTFMIKILNSTTEKLEVSNILGSSFCVPLSDKEVNHLFAGELGNKMNQITLKSFTPDESNASNLQNILKESCRIFIETINGTQTNNESLDQIWEDIGESKQLEIIATRERIIKHFYFFLRSLSVKNDKLQEYLRDWDEYDDHLELLKVKNQNISEIEDKIHELMNEIKTLIETDEIIKNEILTAVRRKIEQYGYQPDSIPFELFQNADDALVELKTMLGDEQLEKERLQYIFQWDNHSLNIIHWGRPINDFINRISQTQFRKNGFERDLIKMLSWNTSDKPKEATGQFGLGFKTVYLISKEPKIISGKLNFGVHAGLLPFPLEDEKLLREQLNNESVSSNIKDGTIINLERDPVVSASIENIADEFATKAGILLIFSKFIKTCKFIGQSTQVLTWHPIDLLGIEGIEFAEVKLLQIQGNNKEWINYHIICLRLEDHSVDEDGCVVIQIPQKLDQQNSPLSELPTFWVTAPTKEKLGLRFIINSKFDVTTGRTSLDRNSQRNFNIAEYMGMKLGEKLETIFNRSKENWEDLCKQLKIDFSTDQYSFWNFIWHIFVLDWLNGINNDDETTQIIQKIFGTKDCGMGYLITQCPSLPNGLWGNDHRQLVCVNQVRYLVTGILAEQHYFEKVSTWTNFKRQYEPDQMILESVWENVKKLLGDDLQHHHQKITLIDVLKAEIPNQEVTPEKAEYLGKLITSDFLQQITNETECEKIEGFLENLKFLSKANKYKPTNQLLIEESNNEEEKYLAGFAEDDRVLHPKYQETGLEFFYACRQNIDILNFVPDTDKINWAEKARNNPEKTKALKSYVNKEESKEKVKNQMKEVSGLSSQTQSQTLPENKPIQLNTQEILEKIYQWWQKEGERHIKKYEQKTYPYGKFPRLSKHDNFKLQEVREQWMILFVLGATYPLGWKGPQQYKNVIVECENLGWWRTFCSPTPQQNSQAWINILDQYFDSKVDQMPYLHWLSRYPVIYLFDRYLEDYIEVFCNIEQVSEEFKLQSFLNSKTSTIFQGSSISLPPLSKVLGIGANFLVRELVRNNIIENSLAYRHCFVPVKRVRELFIKLGCQLQDKANIENSITIHDFLLEHLGKEKANFNNAFDIPFQLLANNPKLRQEIFKQDIDLDDDDMDENQFYDNDEE